MSREEKRKGKGRRKKKDRKNQGMFQSIYIFFPLVGGGLFKLVAGYVFTMEKNLALGLVS